MIRGMAQLFGVLAWLTLLAVAVWVGWWAWSCWTRRR